MGKSLALPLVIRINGGVDQRHGPVLLFKTEFSDGFYQLHLTPSGALVKLAVPLLQASNEAPLIAVSTHLPMKWTESPPAFSVATETVADRIINAKLESSNNMLHIPWKALLRHKYH